MSKRKKQKQQGWPRGLRRNAGWIIAGAVTAVVAIVVLVLVLAGGSTSDSTSGSVAATPTPDPRVAGATPATSVSVNADDDGQNVNPRFEPNVIEGNAGDVTEIVIKNVGSVAHDLRVSGVDKEYQTTDDFASAAVEPGKEQRLLVRIDTPGSYPFRCDFHPQQTGTLVIN